MPKFIVWNVWSMMSLVYATHENLQKTEASAKNRGADVKWSLMVAGCHEKVLVWFTFPLFRAGREANQNLVTGSSRLKVDFGAGMPRTQINDQRAAAIRGCAVFNYTGPGVDISGHGHMARVGEEMYLDWRKNQRLVRVCWHWGQLLLQNVWTA